MGKETDDDVIEHVKLACEGEVDSLDELWLRYRKLGYLVLRKYKLCDADKDSVIWEAICRAIQSFDPDKGAFSTYFWRWCVLYAIALIRDSYIVRRPGQAGAICEYLDGCENSWVQEIPCAAEVLDQKRKRAAVRKVIRELPERQQLIVGWQMRGLGVTEAALKLGVSKQRVHNVNVQFEKRVMEEVGA